MFPRESQHRCHSVFSALGLNILLCWAWIRALNIRIHISAMAGRVEVFKSVSLDWPDAHLWSLRSLFRISDILKDVNKVQCLALIRVLITAIKWSGYLTVGCQPHMEMTMTLPQPQECVHKNTVLSGREATLYLCYLQAWLQCLSHSQS